MKLSSLMKPLNSCEAWQIPPVVPSEALHAQPSIQYSHAAGCDRRVQDSIIETLNLMSVAAASCCILEV